MDEPEEAAIKDEELTTQTVQVTVPRSGTLTTEEGIRRLFEFLRSVDIDCELVDGGRTILYGPNIEGDEAEFLEGLLTLFQMRILIN